MLGFLTRLGMIPIVCAVGISVQAEPIAGIVSVVDGDTLEIHGTRIRLHGIDAPESGQSCRTADGKSWRCGQRAALALSDRLGRKRVTCTELDKDRYGRIVSVCRADGTDINQWMVAGGYAMAYRRYSADYVAAEDAARVAGIGIWQGAFIAPWDWRKGERLPTAVRSAASNGDCRIKGNISSSGERIYHVPDGAFYKRTKIDKTKGERWFCTESEARAVGWRASKR